MRPRAELRQAAPAFHGGAPPAAGLVLDFSVCTNPLGPAPSVRHAAASAAIHRYPEPAAATLRAALAARGGVAAERVVVSNGSVEVFWLVAAAYLERGDRVLVVGPTFAEYARAARLMGANVAEYRPSADTAFRPDLPDLVATIRAVRPRLTFLCNPNNPTGAYLDAAQVAALLAATPGLLVLDEAYVGLTPDAWDAGPLLDDERLVLVRSLTKDHALPGLRLGYAVGAPDVVRALQWAQPPWSVNAAAQAAGLAALAADDHVARGRRLAAEATGTLAVGLERLGLRVVPWAANFFLVDVGDAATITGELLKAGIYVRDCTSFGLPTYVRIAARPLDECAALLQAMECVVRTTASGAPPRVSEVGA